MRRDVTLLAGAVAALAALVAVSWRATLDRSDVTVILYVLGGILEAAGIVVTALDIRSKQRIARAYIQSRPLPGAALRPTLSQVFGPPSAAHTITYGQLERIGGPVLASLDGRLLALAAALLLAGIGVGTAANILSATA